MAKPKQSAARTPKPGQAKAAQPKTAQPKTAQPKDTKVRPVPPKAMPPRATAPKAKPLPPPEPEPMPSTVRNAVRLMYAGAVISGIDLVVSLATAGQVSSAIQSANPHWSHAKVENAAHSEITASVVIWLVTIGFWVVMARTNQAGRGWARIVATVLSVISTLSFAEAIIEPAALVSKLIYVPLWVVGVGAVIFLWRPATTDYIRAGRA
ncbi:MAG TPA: hypothetical protein VHU92_30275 [Streptosporangiaceae bacterium]|nr:hypothetical protein [Streptosporangiaceae bacterium]